MPEEMGKILRIIHDVNGGVVNRICLCKVSPINSSLVFIVTVDWNERKSISLCGNRDTLNAPYLMDGARISFGSAAKTASKDDLGGTTK